MESHDKGYASYFLRNNICSPTVKHVRTRAVKLEYTQEDSSDNDINKRYIQIQQEVQDSWKRSLLKKAETAGAFGIFAVESVRTRVTLQALIDLHKTQKQCKSLLDQAEELITTMPEEDKQTLCCQVIALLHRMWDKLPMDTQHTVKSCICEGKITEAKSVLQKIHDDERSRWLRIEHLGAAADLGSSFGVIYTRLDFIFKGFEKLEMEDNQRTIEYRRTLARRSRTLKELEMNFDEEKLNDLLDDVKQLRDSIQIQADNRETERNDNYASSVLYGMKAVLNIVRFYYLKDNFSSLLYLGASGLSVGTSYACWNCARKYDRLLVKLRLEVNDVIEFYKEVIALEHVKKVQ